MAEPFIGVRRNPRTYRRGRVCAAPGCATRLSIYNSTAVCAEHNPYRVRSRRARDRRPDVHEADEGPVEVLHAEAS